MPRTFDAWRALPGNERRLLVGLVLLLPLIDILLRLLGLGRTCVLLAGPPAETVGRAAADGGGGAIAARLARLVDIASRRGPCAASCLRRALALRWLLRRRGLPAELRIGVTRQDGDMRAHAWVEIAGSVVGGSPETVAGFHAYRELERRLPGALRTS